MENHFTRDAMLQRWVIVAACLALAQIGRSQSASPWRAYTATDGLAETACTSLSVNPGSRVLVFHTNPPAITVLDGYRVRAIPAPPALVGDVAASPGGQIWAVSRQGLLELRDNKWSLHPVAKIADEFRTNHTRLMTPIPLVVVRQGHVVFLLPDRLMEFNAEDPAHPRTSVVRTSDQAGTGSFTDMVVAHDGGLWITGARGLAKTPGLTRTDFSAEWPVHLPPTSLQIEGLKAPHEDGEGGIIAVANKAESSQIVMAHFSDGQWSAEPVPEEGIKQSWNALDGTRWAMTGEALLRSSTGNPPWIRDPELAGSRYRDVAVDPGDTFWLATSEGLFHYTPPAWRTPQSVRNTRSPIESLTEDARGRLWFVTDGELHSLDGDVHMSYPLAAAFTRASHSIRAIYALSNGSLLLDNGEIVLRFEPVNARFSLLPLRDDVRQSRVLGRLNDGSICMQSWRPNKTAAAPATFYLDSYDGHQFTPLTNPPPTPDCGDGFRILFAARNGDLWLSGQAGIAWCHEERWRTFPIADETVPDVALCFTELANGRVWCATQDRLWEFDGRNWLSVRAGFDHINSLLCTRDGSVWVADEAGLHRFSQEVWVDNEKDEGLPSEVVLSALQDQRGRVWAGTSNGLTSFHPEADADPPRTYIKRSADKEPTIKEGAAMTVTFRGEDKWKFTSPERLLYSYRLDEQDWSSFQEAKTVSFADLRAGQHYFQVRALDRNGNIDPKPALLAFVVTTPWYKELRLVFIAVVGSSAALFFAGLAFNRHRQLLRSYSLVERKVAERTRELDIAHRELAHSQKMNALGTLAAGIAHDFNNILSIIKGSAQIIEENADQPQKIRTRVDRIKTVVEQGAGIVNAMLGFSSSSGEESARCDLNAVVADTIRLLGDRFLREVEVRFEPTSDLPEVVTVKNFVQQALLNFTFNAAEAMTERKQVVVTTCRLNALPDILILVPKVGNSYVSVAVRDTGCGIAPDVLPRIFEPFYTSKALSTKRGTGLGLSMVYELAKKLDAGLAVESVVGQGSTFTLILPVTESAP